MDYIGVIFLILHKSILKLSSIFITVEDSLQLAAGFFNYLLSTDSGRILQIGW